MRVVFQSVQSRTNYQHCYILVSSAESGMYRYDGNWCIEPKMGLCGTGFTVYRVLVYNPAHGVSHHWKLHCFFNSLFMLSRKYLQSSALPELCEGYPLVTLGFPLRVFSYAENVSRSWSHHVSEMVSKCNGADCQNGGWCDGYTGECLCSGDYVGDDCEICK